MMRTFLFAAALGAGLAIAPAAAADPCEGALPRQDGAHFAGVVRYVGDGDSLCVGESDDPASWIEVRLADFDAPELNEPGGAEGRAIARRVLMGRRASCTTTRGRSGRTTSWDRVFALCAIDGRPIGDLLREANAPRGGR